MSNSSAKVTLVDLPNLTVVGLGADFVSVLAPHPTASVVIPKLWGQLSEVIAAANKAMPEANFFSQWMIGAMGEPERPAYDSTESAEDEGLMHYFAGLRVNNLDAVAIEPLVAAGLQARSFVGGKYAVCEHRGLLDSLPDTTAWFYKTWLPGEGPSQRYGHHFEIYDERFAPGEASSVMLICAPVQ